MQTLLRMKMMTYLMIDRHFPGVHVVTEGPHLAGAWVLEHDHRVGAVTEPAQDAREVGGAHGQDHLVGVNDGFANSQGHVGKLFGLECDNFGSI